MSTPRAAWSLLAALCGLAACSFDWDQYDPRLAAGGAAAGGAAGGGASGGGGTGGQASPGYCRTITVSTASAAVPAGYSARLVFDHASLVAEGKSQPDGGDVRVYQDVGGSAQSIHRVLGLEASWNTGSTAMWFATQAAIEAQQDDPSYALCYGASNAGPLLDDPQQVFLFWDDFESGDLGKWTSVTPGYWSVPSGQARSGSFALQAGEVSGTDRWLVADGLAEADIVFDAFWFVSTLAAMDVSQGVRVSSASLPIDQYEVNLAGGWYIAKHIADVFTGLEWAAGGPAVGSWTRVSLVILSSGMKLLVGGAPLIPPAGYFDVGTELASGSVAFRAYEVPAGEAWRIDDARVRRYVDPEPTVTLGVEGRAP